MHPENLDIDSLFAQTLIGDYDDDAPWAAVRSLHNLGSREILDRAVEWCSAEDALKRARAADVLAQLGKSKVCHENLFPEEPYRAVAQLLRDETEIQPIASAICALGHLGNIAAIPQIVTFANHSNEEVRFAVACALGHFANDPSAVATLILLSRDPDSDVRDWATFGFGVQGSLDDPEIREALLARLNDPDEDVAEEALIGACARGDLRCLSALLESLDDSDPGPRVFEAAELLLGAKPEQQDWTAAQYIEALKRRFPA
jgi:HEAT repeat protein